jgi:hypothetical protein
MSHFPAKFVLSIAKTFEDLFFLSGETVSIDDWSSHESIRTPVYDPGGVPVCSGIWRRGPDFCLGKLFY